jgi:hypothetical protein
MFTIYPRAWLQLVKPFPEMPILVSMEVTRIAIGYGGHIDPYQPGARPFLISPIPAISHKDYSQLRLFGWNGE